MLTMEINVNRYCLWLIQLLYLYQYILAGQPEYQRQYGSEKMFKDLNLQLRDQATYRKPIFALRRGLRMAAAWKIASTMSILTAECLAVNGQIGRLYSNIQMLMMGVGQAKPKQSQTLSMVRMSRCGSG